MKRVLLARLVLAFIGIVVWGYGQRANLPKTRVSGMGILLVALLLRFVPAPSVITADQLAENGLLGTVAFDAIQRLRPQFLVDSRAGRSLSQQPTMVSVNNGELHPLSYLRTIPSSTIDEIRFLHEGEAGQRLGPRTAGSAVILVTLKRP